MSVTRFSRIFSTIFSLRDITGREENLEAENEDENDELQEEVGDGGDAILRSSPLLCVETETVVKQMERKMVGLYLLYDSTNDQRGS